MIPPTIRRVDSNLTITEPVEISSPRAPINILLMPMLYRTVNRALVPATAPTKDAGPIESAPSIIISPACAVTKSFTATKRKAGLLALNSDLTSL